MKEIKTLKEIDFNVDKDFINNKVGNEHIKRVLKQDAINDIKELLKIVNNNSVYSLPIKFGDFLINPSETFREVFKIIDYIKWKNNLNEEDLK
jgi:hypothetical protein